VVYEKPSSSCNSKFILFIKGKLTGCSGSAFFVVPGRGFVSTASLGWRVNSWMFDAHRGIDFWRLHVIINKILKEHKMNSASTSIKTLDAVIDLAISMESHGRN